MLAYVTLLLSYMMEVYEKIAINNDENRTENEMTWLKVLVIVNRTYSLLIDVPFMWLQWIYLVEFLKLKNKQAPITESCGAMIGWIWIFLILILNSLNTIVFNGV